MRTGVLWKFIGQIGLQSARFATVAVLARLLEPADYGSAAVAIALATFAPTVGDMGMGAALDSNRPRDAKGPVDGVLGSLAFGASISALFVVFAVPVGRFLDDPRIGTMVAVGALTFVIYSLGSTSHATFMRAMNFRTIELRFMLALVVASVVSIIAAASGLGPGRSCCSRSF